MDTIYTCSNICYTFTCLFYTCIVLVFPDISKTKKKQIKKKRLLIIQDKKTIRKWQTVSSRTAGNCSHCIKSLSAGTQTNSSHRLFLSTDRFLPCCSRLGSRCRAGKGRWFWFWLPLSPPSFPESQVQISMGTMASLVPTEGSRFCSLRK